MNKAGYTDLATSVGLRTLKRKGMVETFKDIDEYHNGEYYGCRLTVLGDDWILENQDQLVFRTEETKQSKKGIKLKSWGMEFITHKF
jgi:hypothetical protein